MLKRLSPFLTLKRLLLAISFLLLIGAGASAAIPGAHRALCPSCFGMIEIRESIYIDTSDQQKTDILLKLIYASTQKVDHYLDGWDTSPRILLCTKNHGPCTRMFGHLGARGTAWGASLVRLNPMGLNKTIMTHELFHAELHHRMGQFGMWMNIIPRWFNEGLAVYLSGDQRFTYEYAHEHKLLAQGIVSLQDWRREVNAETWKTVYGASAQLVKEIEDDIGPGGILELINRVTEDGEDFDEVLTELTAQ